MGKGLNCAYADYRAIELHCHRLRIVTDRCVIYQRRVQSGSVQTAIQPLGLNCEQCMTRFSINAASRCSALPMTSSSSV